MSMQTHRPASHSIVHVVIVGAGASGLACALHLAQMLDQHGLRKAVRIEVYESSKKIGHSILASGNGRCNYSNTKLYDKHRPAEQAHSYYTNPDFVKQVRSVCCEALAPAPEWLSSLGLLGCEAKASDGMLFPASNQARTVLDTLLHWCALYDITIVPQTRVDTLSRTEAGRFSLTGIRSVVQVGDVQVKRSSSKKARKPAYEDIPFTRMADVVVLAVGHALQNTPNLALTHPLVPMRFVLGPLIVESAMLDIHDFKRLDGLRQRVVLRVVAKGATQPCFVESGEVLFRSYGISGIVVFNASRYAQSGDTVVLDLLPDFEKEDLSRHMIQTCQAWFGTKYSSCDQHAITIEEAIKAALVGVLAEPLYKAIESLVSKIYYTNTTASITSLDEMRVLCHRVTEVIKALSFSVKTIALDQVCQVMRGGCDVADVDPATCESRVIPHFYITGEALDVDGPCGGFNLDWAWTSGIVAGQAIGSALVTAQQGGNLQQGAHAQQSVNASYRADVEQDVNAQCHTDCERGRA